MRPLALTSVVVPLFNDRTYVADCIESVLRQEGAPLEVVVVDDAGTDGSAEVVEQLMDTDDRIRLIRHDRNRGLAAARNTGLGFAQGEFVTFLDADDFLFPDSVQKRARRLRYKSGNSAVIAGSYSGWEMVPEDAGLDWSPTAKPKNKRLRYVDVAGNNPLIATAPLLWRACALDVGGFDESYSTAEDFEFWTRLLRQGYELIPCGIIGVAYRQKSSSMIANGLAAHATAALRVLDYVERPLGKDDISQGAPAPVRQSISEHRRHMLYIRRLSVFLAIAIGAKNDVERDALLGLVPSSVRTSDFTTRTGLNRNIAAGVQRFELQTAEMTEAQRSELAGKTRSVLMEHIEKMQSGDDRSASALRFPLAATLARGTESQR